VTQTFVVRQEEEGGGAWNRERWGEGRLTGSGKATEGIADSHSGRRRGQKRSQIEAWKLDTTPIFGGGMFSWGWEDGAWDLGRVRKSDRLKKVARIEKKDVRDHGYGATEKAGLV